MKVMTLDLSLYFKGEEDQEKTFKHRQVSDEETLLIERMTRAMEKT